MKNRSLCVILAILVVSISAAAGAKGGGKGPSKVGQTDNRAEFIFPVDPATGAILAGDIDNASGWTSYKDSEADPGLAAYFFGSGNPKLAISEYTDRALIIRLDGSGPSGTDPVTGQALKCPAGTAALPAVITARGDGLWFSGLNSDPEGNGESMYGGMDGNRFLDMQESDSELYSIMPIRFLHVDEDDQTEYLYSMVFGSIPDNWDGIRTRVGVTRSGDTWWIRGINQDGDGNDTLQSTARIQRSNVKGKRVTEYIGHCDVTVDFLIRLLPTQ